MTRRPDTLDVMRILSHLYLAHGHPERAMALLKAARLLAPEDKASARLMARALIRCGRPEAALQFLDGLLDAGEAAPVVQLLRGQALAQCGRPVEARRAFEEFSIMRRAMAAAPGVH